MYIDVNADTGEGTGNDEALMPFITSANIACGFHAGDEETMKRTVDLCVKYGVAIGAHPSYFDRENFGRSEMNLAADELKELVLQQLAPLDAVAKRAGTKLHHVKPHGALYNQSAKNKLLAKAIAAAVKEFNAKFILYGLSGSHSIREAKEAGLQTASEVFADRTYADDGTLTPRSQSGALIDDDQKAVRQVLQMTTKKTVTTLSGKTIPIVADTVCLHGDGPHAVTFALNIFHALQQQNIVVKKIETTLL